MLNSTTLITARAAKAIERSGNDLADVAAVVSQHKKGNHAVPFHTARHRARAIMADPKAIRSIDFVVMRACDSVELVRFGCRGGVKRIARILNPLGQAV